MTTNHTLPLCASLALAALLALLCRAVAAPVDELCLTGNARRNQNLRLGVTVHPERAGVLLDGSHLDAKSIGWADGAVTIAFGEPVRLSRAQMVVYNDRERSYNAARRMRLEALVVRQGSIAIFDLT